MDKYYENKRRLSGEERICESCGFTKLSLFNETKICSGCTKRPTKDKTRDALVLITNLGAV